ncbi:hypothetical protein [uncultured Methylobacterium sp.]|uniref:hypothetical protein n=1 Tax=uncultured Methylobacterium sp. TaxID=157278 RepID=UPI0035CAFF4E
MRGISASASVSSISPRMKARFTRSSSAPVRPVTALGVDPIFAATAAAVEAERCANGDILGQDALVGTPEGKAHDEERNRRTDLSDDAYRAMFDIIPAIQAGLIAMLHFTIEQQEILDRWESGSDVLGAIRTAVAAHMGGVRETPGPDPVFAVLERF